MTNVQEGYTVVFGQYLTRFCKLTTKTKYYNRFIKFAYLTEKTIKTIF